jgi:hypothetical protein
LIGKRRQTLHAVALALVLSSIAVGCGGNAQRSASVTTPTATPPAAPSPTTPRPQTTTAATTPTAPGERTTVVGAETQPGGAGDEQGAAVPAKLVIDGATVTPQEVRAPAFLQLQLDVRSADGRSHTVQVGFPTPATVAVPPGGEALKVVPGQRPGAYPISVDGAVTDATLRLAAS